MSADVVICDILKKGDFTELAVEIAKSAGFEPLVVSEHLQAQEALGYFTHAVVTTVGWPSAYVPNRHDGIMLLSTADILDLPKAVVDDDNVDEAVMRLIKEPDIIVKRNDLGATEKQLGKWLYALASRK